MLLSEEARLSPLAVGGAPLEATYALGTSIPPNTPHGKQSLEMLHIDDYLSVKPWNWKVFACHQIKPMVPKNCHHESRHRKVTILRRAEGFASGDILVSFI